MKVIGCVKVTVSVFAIEMVNTLKYLEKLYVCGILTSVIHV